MKPWFLGLWTRGATAHDIHMIKYYFNYSHKIHLCKNERSKLKQQECSPMKGINRRLVQKSQGGSSDNNMLQNLSLYKCPSFFCRSFFSGNQGRDVLVDVVLSKQLLWSSKIPTLSGLWVRSLESICLPSLYMPIRSDPHFEKNPKWLGWVWWQNLAEVACRFARASVSVARSKVGLRLQKGTLEGTVLVTVRGNVPMNMRRRLRHNSRHRRSERPADRPKKEQPVITLKEKAVTQDIHRPYWAKNCKPWGKAFPVS